MTRPASLRRAALVATAVLALARCDWDGTRIQQNLPAAIALVSGHGQTGTVAQALALPLVVRVTNSKGEGVEGVAVSWAVLGAGGTLSASATPTDTTGKTSVMWTLGPVAGTHNHAVAATVNGLRVPPVTFIASADPGAPSRLVVISGNTQTGTVGQALPQPLVVAVQDQYLNRVRDVAVTWAVAAGGGSVSSTSIATDAAGTASVSWTIGTAAGTDKDTATAAVYGLTGSPVRFTATANPGRPSRLVMISGDGQTATVGQALPQPLVVAVQDQYLNGVRDVPVTWAAAAGGGSVSSSSVATDATGQASVTWTLGTVAGTINHMVAVTVGGLTGPPVTFTATANPGPPSRLVAISGNGQTGAVGQQLGQPLVVAVQDQYVNLLGDVAVTWAITSGGGSVSSSSVTTGATGQASVTWTLGTVAGTNNHTATATVSGLTGSPVTFAATANPGPPSRLVVISGNGQTGAVGQALSQPLVVAVQDQYLNGVRDVAVTWAVAAAAGSVSSTSVATDAAGRAAVTWTLGTVAGTSNQTVAATVSGLTGSPVAFTATANPGTPSRLVAISGNAQTGAVGQALPQPLVVTVQDQYLNLLRDVAVTWAVTSGGGSVSSGSVATDAAGRASVTWTLGTVAGTNSQTVAATVSGVTGPPVKFSATANPGPPSRLVGISGSGQSGAVGRALLEPLVVAVQDQYLNGVRDVAVTWAVAAGGGSVSSGSVTTDADGQASVTWTLGTVAGANGHTAAATVSGLGGSPVTFTATASPAPPRHVVVISGNGQTATVGQVLPQPLVVAVQDEYLNGVRDVAVTWGVAAGGGSVSSSSVATDAAGRASVSWTLGTVAGTINHTVAVTVGGLTGPPVTFTATANPGPPSRLVVISGNGQSGAVGQQLGQPLVVAVQDQYVNRLGDVAVTWAITSGGGSVSSSSVTSAADGQASVTWTLGTVAGANSHTATATVSGHTGSPITFAATANPGPPSRLVVISGTGQTGAVGQALSQPLVVAVQDQYLNGVRDVAVTWAVAAAAGSVSSTSVATDAAGRASVTWTLGTVAGTNNHAAAATVNGLTGSPVTFTATANPGPPSRLVAISGSAQTGAVGQALPQPLVVAVQDPYLNLLRDVAVTWAVTSGGGSVSSTSVTTDATGRASVTWTLGTVAGTSNHSAAATVSGLTGSPVTFAASANPGPPSRLVPISGNGQSGAVGQQLGQPLVVAVQDQYLNGVRDVAVTWAVAAAAGSVSSTSVATDAAGRASVTWTLGTVAGTNNHTAAATVSGLAGSPVTFAATANPGPPSRLVVISGNGQTGAVGQQLGQPLVVAVQDQYLNGVRDVAVTWAVAAAAGSVSSTSVATDPAGRASVSWTLGTVAGTNNHAATATVSGLTGSPATFTATANPGPPSRLVVISGNGQTATVGQTLPQPLVVAVQDQYVNLLRDVAVTWAVTSGGGSVSSGSVATDAAGRASVTWTLGTVAGTGSHAAAATVSGLAGSPVTFTATATPGPPSGLVVISGNGQTGAVGQALSQPLVVAVQDQYLNGVRDVVVTWAVAAAAGSLSSSSVATDAAGRASVTWTIGTVAGTDRDTARATVVGLTGSPLTFTASGTPGPAARLFMVSGDGQRTQVAQPVSLVVAVRDQYDNGVSGVAVGWAVVTGGGSMSASSVPTGADGSASVTWTLGPTAGSHTSRATLDGVSGSPVTFTAIATPGPAARLVIAGGNGQTAPAATALPLPLTARVTDASGNALSDIAVAWSVTTGAGTLSTPAPRTGPDGIAASHWTLGRFAGTQTVSASAGTLQTSPVTFSATATPNATVSGTITLSGLYLAPPQIVTNVATADARSAAQLFVGSQQTQGAPVGAEYVPGELIVRFRAQALGAPPVGSLARAAPAAVRAVAGDIRSRLSVREAAGELRTRGVSPVILAARVQVTDPAQLDAVAERLRRDPSVAAVERNGLVYGDHSGRTPMVVATTPSDLFAPDQAWHYGMMDLPQAWDITRGSASVLVAVIDDGIRFDHPDIAANLTSDGYDFVADGLAPRCGAGGLVSVSGDGDGYDPDPTVPVLYQRTFSGCVGDAVAAGGHGLHVAGTIGAAGNNGVGVSGVNWTVRIRPIRALSSVGSGNEYDVAQAILYAAGLPADNGAGGTVAPAGAARVINMSLGGPGLSQVMHDAIKQATAVGALVVAAAGNTGGPAPIYPAAFDEVLSVSALGPDAKLATYSSFGPTVDIAAPGGDLEDGGCTFGVTSTWWNFAASAPAYACIHGTSMASPHVAGVAALVLAQSPGLTAAQLRSRLTTYAVDVGPVGRDDKYGAGIVNARNSLTQSLAPPRQLYARLYDAGSGSAVRTIVTQPDGSYVFTALPDGAYYVYAGQDENGDQRIGEPGRRWGAYGESAAPGSVDVSGAGPYSASFTIGFPVEREPNGTRDVANVLPVGGYLTGHTSPSGADYARVQVAEPGTYTFETVPVDGACGFALEENTILDLLDAGGALLVTNDDIDAATRNYCSRISMPLSAGTYYLRVKGTFGGRFAVKARSGT